MPIVVKSFAGCSLAIHRDKGKALALVSHSVFGHANIQDLATVLEEILKVCLLKVIREVADKKGVFSSQPESFLESINIEIVLIVKALQQLKLLLEASMVLGVGLFHP